MSVQDSLIKIVTQAPTSIKISAVFSATIICLIYNCISNPAGAVNHFMVILIDNFYGIFPSTPEHYTIGFMLEEFAKEHPYVGWGVIYEIFAGMSGMFGLWCVVKLWQLLPFT